MGNPISPTLSSNSENRRACFCQTSPGMLKAQIDQGIEQRAKPSLVFPTAMVVKVKDADTKRNKASVAHTRWNKRIKIIVPTTPEKVCLYSRSLQLLFQQKMCKSEIERAAGKPDTPCDWASCVKERGLMRSSSTVLQSPLLVLIMFLFPCLFR